MSSTSDEVGHTLDLDAIEARANAATPGPWDTCCATLVRAIKGDLAAPLFRSEAPIDWHTKRNVTHKVLCRAYADEVNNATFIAHARTDIPALVAECRSLRNSHDSLVKALENAESALRYCEQNSLSPNDILRPKVEVTIKSITAALSQAKGGK